MIYSYEYKGHEIKMQALINSGTRYDEEGASLLTHSLFLFVDEVMLSGKEELIDDELLALIPNFKILAEKRIDLIGTPGDSPIVLALIELGFILE